MLDPKLIKENPQIIQDMLKARSVEFDLEGLIEKVRNVTDEKMIIEYGGLICAKYLSIYAVFRFFSLCRTLFWQIRIL